MHGRRRMASYLPSHRRGMRSSGHRYRSYGHSRYSRDHRRSFTPSPPPLRPSKLEILIEAGRLAVEYFVSKGFLPSSLVDGKLPHGKLQESKRCNKETLAVERGKSVPFSRVKACHNVGHRRRRYDEDDDYMDQRRERRRTNSCSLGCRSECHRESRGDRRFRKRSRGYDYFVEDEDDFTLCYHNHLKGRAGVSQGGVSRTSRNEWYCGREVSGNLLMEVENYENMHDIGLRKSSISTKKSHKIEGNWDVNAQVDESKMLISDACYEVKNDGDGYLDSNFRGKDLHSRDFAVQGGKAGGDDFDLLKLCDFAKIPTKLRTSISQRLMAVEQGSATKIVGVSQEYLEEKLLETFSNNSQLVRSRSLESDTNDIPDVLSGTSVNQLGYKTSRLKLGLLEEHSSAEIVNCNEETMNARNPFFETEEPHENNFRTKCSNSSMYESRPSLDGEVIALIGQERVAIEPFFTSVGKKHDTKLGKGRQTLPASFNIYDLNFMKSPETIKGPDDPSPYNLPRPAAILKNETELSASFILSGDNKSNETSCSSWVYRDGKNFPAIDLENGCRIASNSCGT